MAVTICYSATRVLMRPGTDVGRGLRTVGIPNHHEGIQWCWGQGSVQATQVLSFQFWQTMSSLSSLYAQGYCHVGTVIIIPHTKISYTVVYFYHMVMSQVRCSQMFLPYSVFFYFSICVENAAFLLNPVLFWQAKVILFQGISQKFVRLREWLQYQL